MIQKNEEYKEENVEQHQINMEMPKFYGSTELERLMEWIEDMQHYFGFHEVEGAQ